MKTKIASALRLAALLVIGSSLANCRLAGHTMGAGLALLPAALAVLPIKLLFSCIPEGTPIDTPEGARPIESIHPGDQVIGYSGKPVKVLQKHAYAEDPEAVRFHEIVFEDGSVVRLCDMHRIGGIRARNVKPGDLIGDRSVRSNTVFGGVERSYDLLTEDAGYRISGAPVDSMIDEMMEAARNGVDSIRD